MTKKCPYCKSLKVIPRPELIGGGYFCDDCGKKFGNKQKTSKKHQ